MDTNSMTISSRLNEQIKCDAYPGHFATNHSHVNYYFDLTAVKATHRLARLAAVELARRFEKTQVDTIICLEGTDVIGAFIADELSKHSPISANSGKDINVLEPEMSSSNQMIFRENTQKMVRGKNVLLIVSTASTGKTIGRTLECLQYYGGQLAGICSLFSAVDEYEGKTINSIFTTGDLPGYYTHIPSECQMCRRQDKIDAIINSYGYSRVY